MKAYGLNGVVGAGGNEATTTAGRERVQDGGNDKLVDVKHPEQKHPEGLPDKTGYDLQQFHELGVICFRNIRQ